MPDAPAAKRTALFISHATPEDNHFVRWLGAKLTAMGYEVWADVMRLHGGIDWARELEDALRKRAVKVLLVCTPSGLEKQGVRNEIEMATNLARQLGDAGFIIPLRLEAYEAPFRIAHAQYIDFKRSWAAGLAELTELLRDKGIPRGSSGPLPDWLESHTDGADRLLQRGESLVSNWLQIDGEPETIRYVESRVGASLERFQNRILHDWPVVPFRAGVITFAQPDEGGSLATELPGKDVAAIPTREFLADGWPELDIAPNEARRMYADLGSQAFERFCRKRGLTGYLGSGQRVSWWGDIKTLPHGQVRFDWPYRRGSRQIIGQSGKRNIHWHYAVNAQLRTSPVDHFRLSARLVFSENGLDPLPDVKRSHTLRRSFAKGWRNARWRDMLCAYLWWLAEGKSCLLLPVAADSHIVVGVPPMQFGSPVTIAEGKDVVQGEDEDDPDIPDDVHDEEQVEEREE